MNNKPEARRRAGGVVTLHRPSGLLTNEENNSLLALLGPRCPSLATSVIQLYESQNNVWRPKLVCGVICFVKDNVQRSYYLRVLDLRRGKVALDQEIYSQFTYKTPKAWFHTFEGDLAVYGLNFADENEALLFKNILETNLRERRLRKERRNAQKRNVCGLGPTAPPPPPPIPTPQQPPHIPYKHITKPPNPSKRKLKKEDISRPTNFKHISHVGWDPNKGFDLENVDPKLLKFFSKAGVSERELKNKKTRDFIYQFIDDHGGVEAAIQEVAIEKKILKSAPPPPAPPPRQSSIGRPLVPPPPRTNKEPPLPPPPPPLPVKCNDDARLNLMEEIRKGGTLRHVTQQDKKASTSNRDDLMSEIRSGITLKKVECSPNNNNINNDEPNGIAGLLQKALQERLSAVGFSSSEGEAGDDEDEEWD